MSKSSGWFTSNCNWSFTRIWYRWNCGVIGIQCNWMPINARWCPLILSALFDARWINRSQRLGFEHETPLDKVYILLPTICAKANSVLGFIACTSRNTLSSCTIKTLVQPIQQNMALPSGHLIKLGTATTSTRAEAFLGSEKCASWTSLCIAPMLLVAKLFMGGRAISSLNNAWFLLNVHTLFYYWMFQL